MKTLVELAGGKAEKVVLLRAGRLGDLLCAVPAFRAIKEGLPEAEVTLIGLPFARDLVARLECLNRFERFPGFSGIADHDFDAHRTLAFLRRMQDRRFDVAIQMHGSGVFSNPFAKLLGAKFTAGFRRPEDGDLGLDLTVPYPQHGHEVRRLLALVRGLGFDVPSERLHFPLLAEDRAELARLLPEELFAGKRSLIGIHPGAEEAVRRWMAERFAAVGAALAMRYGGTPVITGTASEVQGAANVHSRMAVPSLNLAGKTSLGGLAALIDRLAVLITNDSGPAHLAYALGTPSVTIFGGEDHRTWGPLEESPIHQIASVEVGCRPCEGGRCAHNLHCLESVSVAEVLDKASAAIECARNGL